MQEKSKNRKLQIEIVTQMLALATSALGLVAALAWNSFIQTFMNEYIKKFLPNSGLVSLLLYALIVTALAVMVTYQLSTIKEKLE
ncbi:MAG TPA: DUF5654 family protein [Patescibacteria group bacterium]|nr:DUF5654 family protein [Patescibacteria group bacterium]